MGPIWKTNDAIISTRLVNVTTKDTVTMLHDASRLPHCFRCLRVLRLLTCFLPTSGGWPLSSEILVSCRIKIYLFTKLRPTIGHVYWTLKGLRYHPHRSIRSTNCYLYCYLLGQFLPHIEPQNEVSGTVLVWVWYLAVAVALALSCLIGEFRLIDGNLRLEIWNTLST